MCSSFKQALQNVSNVQTGCGQNVIYEVLKNFILLRVNVATSADI